MTDAPRPGEFGLIAWIRQHAPGNPRVRLGIGDDCAVIDSIPGFPLLVTTDMLMDGRHFRLAEAGAAAVGYKALGVNLSDIAAMGGTPIAAFVAVALPRDCAAPVARDLLEAMLPLAARFGVALAGGDTNAWDGPLVVCVTVLGDAGAGGPITRSGARAGDAILVTGPLGGSLQGRHLHPAPRIEEALAIRQAAPIHAMIDLSDGLSSDLAHILQESGGLGASLEAQAIPLHADAHTLAARTGHSPLHHALHDGEDFELCLTMDPSAASRLLLHPPRGVELVHVGTVEELPGIRLRWPDGRAEPLAPGGFDHLATGPAEVVPDVIADPPLVFHSRSPADTVRLAHVLADLAPPGTVIGLVGPLGAGKTFLSRAIAEALGVDPAAIASPTFVLIHEYEGRLPVYHFDTYRLRSPEQFEALGVEEYWSAGGVCLVEWADRVADQLPSRSWWISLEHDGPDSRVVTIRIPPGPDAISTPLASALGRLTPDRFPT